MRSSSQSSCSSLSSLATVQSASSAASLSSLTDLQESDLDREGGPCFQPQEASSPPPEGGSQEGRPSTLGKRKRKPEKEARKRVRRQGRNPRKRTRPRKERLNRSKMGQALGMAIRSDLKFTPKHPFKKLKEVEELGVLDIFQAEEMGMTVVPWGGM